MQRSLVPFIDQGEVPPTLICPATGHNASPSPHRSRTRRLAIRCDGDHTPRRLSRRHHRRDRFFRQRRQTLGQGGCRTEGVVTITGIKRRLSWPKASDGSAHQSKSDHSPAATPDSAWKQLGEGWGSPHQTEGGVGGLAPRVQSRLRLRLRNDFYQNYYSQIKCNT
jgi:hypothetical protein